MKIKQDAISFIKVYYQSWIKFSFIKLNQYIIFCLIKSNFLNNINGKLI